MRTLYSPNNFTVDHTAVLAAVIMLYTASLELAYLITRSFYLLAIILQLPSPPHPTKLW